jgi:hypothetical protein
MGNLQPSPKGVEPTDAVHRLNGSGLDRFGLKI